MALACANTGGLRTLLARESQAQCIFEQSSLSATRSWIKFNESRSDVKPSVQSALCKSNLMRGSAAVFKQLQSRTFLATGIAEVYARDERHGLSMRIGHVCFRRKSSKGHVVSKVSHAAKGSYQLYRRGPPFNDGGGRRQVSAPAVASDSIVTVDRQQSLFSQQRFEKFLLDLQSRICDEAEAADGSGAKFCEDKWSRGDDPKAG